MKYNVQCTMKYSVFFIFDNVSPKFFHNVYRIATHVRGGHLIIAISRRVNRMEDPPIRGAWRGSAVDKWTVTIAF